MRVLLTGANGYIGRRLKRVLKTVPEIQLRLMVRNAATLGAEAQGLEVVEASTFDPASLRRALAGVDVAYYLIHALASGPDFRQKDHLSAENFLQAAIECGVKRIIYLGGLGDKTNASEHLISRIETGEVLSSRPDQIQTLWFRAGVIIGSGSASFEIIRNLVQKLPVLITPKWVSTPAQPIGVGDVVRYLSEAATLPHGESEVIDIGTEAMSYGEIMLRAAKVMGLKRRLIAVPVLTPNLSSYWLTLFTPVPFTVAHSLIEGLSSPVLVQNDRAQALFGFSPQPYEAAVAKAIEEIEANQVISRWSDSDGAAWEKHQSADIADAILIDRRRMPLGELSAHQVYRSITSLGGDSGWFDYDWLWELSGAIDKLLGGYGTNRGRRDACDLRLGECLDFWRGGDLQPDVRLLLFAQMRLPGRAWLEFVIWEGELIQTAYFYPSGVLGRLYWYALLPAHFFIFRNLIKRIVERAAQMGKV